jgi:hypothetical protein
MNPSRLAAILLGLLLAGCAASGAQSSRVQATAGALTLAAEPGSIQPGQRVGLQLTVAGPLDYDVGCTYTEHLWAVDSHGQRIWDGPFDIPSAQVCGLAEAGPPKPFVKHLAKGASLTFKAEWQTTSNLKPGSYSIHGEFLASHPVLAAPVISIRVA